MGFPYLGEAAGADGAVGGRYTDASNSSVYALDPFVLTDLSMSNDWSPGRHRMNFCFLIKNLFDVSYQLYSGRAMPGRNYTLKISYQLKPKNK